MWAVLSLRPDLLRANEGYMDFAGRIESNDCFLAPTLQLSLWLHCKLDYPICLSKAVMAPDTGNSSEMMPG